MNYTDGFSKIERRGEGERWRKRGKDREGERVSINKDHLQENSSQI